MKKLIAMLIITAMLGALASCGKTEDPAGTSGSSSESADEMPETQPDPLAPTEAEEEAETDAPAEAETEAVSYAPADTEQVDPLGTGAFSLDEDGAVVFADDAAAESDRTLIAAAQTLFESACQTEFSYTVGCPYEVDSTRTITVGDFGWMYYLITTPGVTSVDDVLADYHKVFSSSHPNSALDSLYVDGEEGVYALCGGRGADIYYSGSKVTQVESRSDSEIVFNVENYYDGTDWGDDAYTETATFSMVLEDGVWRADQFVLPY